MSSSRMEKGVTNVVSTIIVLGIVMGSIAMILQWGLPYTSEKEMGVQFKTSQSNFGYISSSIDNLILEGDESKSVADIVGTSTRGRLKVNSSGDKLIIMYSFNDTFDFNVTGLDDGDNAFKIEMRSFSADSPTFDAANVYWLEPEGVDSSFYAKTDPHKKVYGNIWCAQKFRPDNSWNLTRVKVYLKIHGVMYSDLNVTIYPDNGGVPDTANPLRNKIVPYSNITSSFEWIDVNFTELKLDNTNDYYIFLNTSGGDKDINYYMWYLNPDMYSDGVAFNGTLVPPSTNELTGSDLTRRLYYTDNSPPVSPWLSSSSSLQPFAGVYYHKIYVNCTDPEDDTISYQLIFGDGYNSSWSGFAASGSLLAFGHRWEQPGTYTMVLKARDEHGNINLYDTKVNVFVNSFEISPVPLDKKAWYCGLRAAADGTITIPADFPGLTGTYCIDLINDTRFVKDVQYYYPYSDTVGRAPFGRIWVFDLGYFSYSSSFDVGTMTVTYQNGAVIKEIEEKKFMKKPVFIENSDALALRFYQVIGDFSVDGSKSTNEISYAVKNSNTREPYYPSVYNLKINITGSNADFWLDYYLDNFDFVELDPSNRPNWIYYHEDVGKSLIFDTSTVAMEWVRIK